MALDECDARESRLGYEPHRSPQQTQRFQNINNELQREIIQRMANADFNGDCNTAGIFYQENRYSEAFRLIWQEAESRGVHPNGRHLDYFLQQMGLERLVRE